MEKMVNVKNGCPICNGDVTGNEKYKYFCKKCFVLFNEEHLNRE